jgi:hypothetical protein
VTKSHQLGRAIARILVGILVGIVVAHFIFPSDAPNPKLHWPAHLVRGQCLDGLGLGHSCTSAEADFIVQRRRTSGRHCSSTSSIIQQGLSAYGPDIGIQPRELSRWCLAFNHRNGR